MDNEALENVVYVGSQGNEPVQEESNSTEPSFHSSEREIEGNGGGGGGEGDFSPSEEGDGDGDEQEEEEEEDGGDGGEGEGKETTSDKDSISSIPLISQIPDSARTGVLTFEQDDYVDSDSEFANPKPSLAAVLSTSPPLPSPPQESPPPTSPLMPGTSSSPAQVPTTQTQAEVPPPPAKYVEENAPLKYAKSVQYFAEDDEEQDDDIFSAYRGLYFASFQEPSQPPKLPASTSRSFLPTLPKTGEEDTQELGRKDVEEDDGYNSSVRYDTILPALPPPSHERFRSVPVAPILDDEQKHFTEQYLELLLNLSSPQGTVSEPYVPKLGEERRQLEGTIIPRPSPADIGKKERLVLDPTSVFEGVVSEVDVIAGEETNAEETDFEPSMKLRLKKSKSMNFIKQKLGMSKQLGSMISLVGGGGKKKKEKKIEEEEGGEEEEEVEAEEEEPTPLYVVSLERDPNDINPLEPVDLEKGVEDEEAWMDDLHEGAVDRFERLGQWVGVKIFKMADSQEEADLLRFRWIGLALTIVGFSLLVAIIAAIVIVVVIVHAAKVEAEEMDDE